MPIKNEHYLDVDLKLENYISLPRVTRNDDVFFIVRILDDGRPVSLDNVQTALLASLRPDKKTILTVGNKLENEITFKIESASLSEPGRVNAAVQLFYTDGRTSTLPFHYEVVPDNSIDYAPSESETSLIQLVLGDAPFVIEAAQSATIGAEDAAAQTLEALDNFDTEKSVAIQELDDVKEENKTNWKQEVATVALRDSTYPNPQIGDTVRITGEARIDRFNGTEWITTDRYNPAVVDELTGKLAETTNKVPWKTPDVFTGNIVQSLVNNAQNGETILLQPGRYLVSSQISWQDKEIHLLALGSVVFVEATPLKEPIIQGTRAHKSTIKGIACEGAETLEGFTGTPDKHYCFIKFIDTNKPRISDAITTKKSFNIILVNCYKSVVENPDLTGFLTTGTNVENGANYSSCVYIIGGSKNNVTRSSAKDCGSIVLMSGNGKKHIVSGAEGENMRDNGVYISSGSSCKIRNVDIDGAQSSGVKARGSKHMITNCEVKNAYIGYSLTGNGAVADAYGYNGDSTICESNIAENCLSGGISVDVQDGLYPRDFKILSNTLINCGNTGTTNPPIKVIQGAGHHVKGNTINGTPSDIGISVTGTDLKKVESADVSQNTVKGDGVTPKFGIRPVYVNRSNFNNNTFEGIATAAIDGRYVKDSSIEGNNFKSGLVVNLTATYLNEGNIVNDNIGANISLDLLKNTASGNYPSFKNFLDTVSNIPYARGQKAIVAGVLYEAVGTTATTDWKQIS